MAASDVLREFSLSSSAATKDPRPFCSPPASPPDDDDDTVEAVVGVLDVAKETQGQELEQHLQTEQAGKNHVADLQYISQLLRLWEERKGIDLKDAADRYTENKQVHGDKQ